MSTDDETHSAETMMRLPSPRKFFITSWAPVAYAMNDMHM